MSKHQYEFIDYDEILEEYEDELGILPSILQSMQTAVIKQYEQVQKDIESQDHKEIVKSSHKLKGSVSQFFLSHLANALNNIEIEARGGRVPGTEEIETLKQLFHKSLKETELLQQELKQKHNVA